MGACSGLAICAALPKRGGCLHYAPMAEFPLPDMGLVVQCLYLLGAAAGFLLAAGSPLPAALFWGIACGLQAALAAVELAEWLGLPGIAGYAPFLRFHNATLGGLALALGALIGLVLPPGHRRAPLLTAIGIALLIAVAAERLPLFNLPLPLIVLALLLVAVLVALRYRPAPGRWLLLAVLLLAAAELARHGYVGRITLGPLSLAPTALARLLTGAGFLCCGLTARATR